MVKIKITLIIVAIITIIIIFNSRLRSEGSISDFTESNSDYKKEYMSRDGRIIDPGRGNITTSEGQSYMMLRSVISNDKETFDLVYNWSVNNLKRKDNLFSWLWGENDKGEYKILDENSASDADVDIAFSLILAHKVWKEKKYLDEALKIINSIWENETRKIDSNIVLMPGVKQAKEEKIEINPSYFFTYAFKLFQKYDKDHDWGKIVDSSYHYLYLACSKTKTGLPPNWFNIENNEIVLQDSDRSDFSYDAVRVFPRIFIDYKMTGDPRALSILEKSKFFIAKWETSKIIYTNYKKNGLLRDTNQYVGSIAVLVPAMAVFDKNIANEIYREDVLSKIEDASFWKTLKDYYATNLIWFGCFLFGMEGQNE